MARLGHMAKERDRDEEGRARNARPRDGLGRPLPHGSPGVERIEEGVVREPRDSLTEAQRLLDEGRPFHAHEILEDAWKSSPEPERELWRGLAQLAVGLTHLARGNQTGGKSLLERGSENIAPFAEQPPHGIAVAELIDWTKLTIGQLSPDRAAPDAASIAPQLSSK